MSEQDLINKISEEIKIGTDLGYEEEHISKNIIAIVKLEREHLDYDSTTHQYDWEQEK